MWQQLKNLYHLLTAILFAILYRFPARKLTVIGVTGTDGKTTTTNLIFHLLKEGGKKVSMISSVNAVIGEGKCETGFHVTTPAPQDIQKYLAQAVKAGSQYFVLESSSHGLSQNRLWGCFFKVGVVTNITHDHLDYHRTYENYLKAKGKLFERVKKAVLNRDDESYKYLKTKNIEHRTKIITYGIKDGADFTPQTFKFQTSLPGEYNQYNCLAATAAASSLGVADGQIKKAIVSFKGIEGRMDEIKLGQNFRVVIDFASTPNSLKNALQTLASQKVKGGRLIAVFGSAGLRDKMKRSMMGEMAGKYADLTILTAEDPRTEDVNQIIEEIAQGVLREGAKEGKTLFRIPDREEAIKFAIQKLVQKGDIVVTCGKGHEKSMCYGQTEYPWNEYEVVQKAIETRNND